MDAIHDFPEKSELAPAQLYSTESGRLFHSGRIVIITVGLPARGKTSVTRGRNGKCSLLTDVPGKAHIGCSRALSKMVGNELLLPLISRGSLTNLQNDISGLA